MGSQSSLQQRRSDQVYFAFGTNMHLGQMAKRCPESRYIGTAKLHDYRFQINQRGFANVLPSLGDCVEGLVYLLNLTDEKRLDQSEGVPTAYQKRNLAIEVFTAAIEFVGRAVPELAQRLEGSESPTVPFEASLKGQAIEALVYLSEEFVQDNEPRNEYIDRMNAGIIDARKLGMSDINAFQKVVLIDRGSLVLNINIDRLKANIDPGMRPYTPKTVAPAIDHKGRWQQKKFKRDGIWDTEFDPRQRENATTGPANSMISPNLRTTK